MGGLEKNILFKGHRIMHESVVPRILAA